MQTLKTAVIVVLLLVVFYGVYEMLNRPPDEPPEDVAQIDAMAFDPPEIQFGESTDAALVQPAASASPTGTASSFVPPAPPSTVPPPPSNYGLETTSSFPADNVAERHFQPSVGGTPRLRHAARFCGSCPAARRLSVGHPAGAHITSPVRRSRYGGRRADRPAIAAQSVCSRERDGATG